MFGSAVLVVLAVGGFLADGYAGERRDLVAFTGYWGLVSVIGYPVATDIQAPWIGYHIVLPLAIPAAVGVGALVRLGVESLAHEDQAGVVLSLLVLSAAAGGVVVPTVDYWNSTAEEDKQVLQWAQPGNDLKGTMEKVDAVARENEGVDVLFYSSKTPNGAETVFYVTNESNMSTPPPEGPAWHSRLPLPWYLERAGANVSSTPPNTPAAEAMADAPPVVIAHDWNKSDLSPHLDGYVVYEHDFRLWGNHIVVFIDRDAMRAAGVDGR